MLGSGSFTPGTMRLLSLWRSHKAEEASLLPAFYLSSSKLLPVEPELCGLLPICGSKLLCRKKQGLKQKHGRMPEKACRNRVLSPDYNNLNFFLQVDKSTITTSEDFIYFLELCASVIAKGD